jgi:hypothetical protein
MSIRAANDLKRQGFGRHKCKRGTPATPSANLVRPVTQRLVPERRRSMLQCCYPSTSATSNVCRPPLFSTGRGSSDLLDIEQFNDDPSTMAQDA